MKQIQESNGNGANQPPLLHDKKSAACRLSVSPVTLSRLVARGKLCRVPGLRKVLIPEFELQRFAATGQLQGEAA